MALGDLIVEGGQSPPLRAPAKLPRPRPVSIAPYPAPRVLVPDVLVAVL